MSAGASATHPFERLTPDFLLDALDTVGIRGDGRLLGLNSYENRVWQVGLEEGGFVVAKFYRPGRWSSEQIDEEHQFAHELVAAEVPMVAPLPGPSGSTRHGYQEFDFAVYPRRGGRAPDLDRVETLERLGHFLGRLHVVGAQTPFVARPALTPVSFGTTSRDYLLANACIPEPLLPAWSAITEQALEAVSERWSRAFAAGIETLRLHGDCHPGNVLWTDQGPHFVDLDDARTGPAIQDLWMLLSGNAHEMGQQLRSVLRGYRAFRRFNRAELALLEPLRTLRLLHYSAWIARRWDDPAFPHNFPWFGTTRYWQDRILELREQVALMQEDPLQVDD